MFNKYDRLHLNNILVHNSFVELKTTTIHQVQWTACNFRRMIEVHWPKTWMLLCPTLFPVPTELTGPKHSTSFPSSVGVAVAVSVDTKEVALAPSPVWGSAVKTERLMVDLTKDGSPQLQDLIIGPYHLPLYHSVGLYLS